MSIGVDVGGTMAKMAFFEHKGTAAFSEMEKVRPADGWEHDDELQMHNIYLNGRVGTLRFCRFSIKDVMGFLKWVRKRGFTICATGGGAKKYAKRVEEELGMHFQKIDEFESLIKGIHFLTANNPDECYSIGGQGEPKNREELQYPCVVCNIGSGVSVLVVRGPNDFERVSGSSIGGGFFKGLCFWLFRCKSFDEAIELATHGDNTKVDLLVEDIYGADGYGEFGLEAHVVAASFGKNLSDEEVASIQNADLACAALVTTTNNIGSIAFNAANQHGIDRIVFVGNFLRNNEIAAKRLAHAMNFWSGGNKKALFLQHQGYFGAVGCLV